MNIYYKKLIFIINTLDSQRIVSFTMMFFCFLQKQFLNQKLDLIVTYVHTYFPVASMNRIVIWIGNYFAFNQVPKNINNRLKWLFSYVILKCSIYDIYIYICNILTMEIQEVFNDNFQIFRKFKQCFYLIHFYT